ncbi:MAG TPA: sugar phosphate isomerase/epimerase [Candidatus Limnocylindria bacterium]
MRVDIGCVPIVWNNVDQPELGPTAPFETILDELARLEFSGCQFSRDFPGEVVPRSALSDRGLRLAEWYVNVPVTDDGLAPEARRMALEGLDGLRTYGGDVLCVAVDGSPARDAFSGRVDAGSARWPDAAFQQLGELLDDLAANTPDEVRIAFHPHVASFVETPREVELLAEALAGSTAGLCLDVAHYTVGGGDPVEAIRRYSALIKHVHAKDVDGGVLGRMRMGEYAGLDEATRARIFTELGNGVVDLAGVVQALDDIGYDGWIMVEQDSSWLPPAEATEIGSRVLRAALAEVGA